MRGSQNNYFSSTLILKKYEASPPTSIPGKGTYNVLLSDIVAIIYKDEEDTAPSSSWFPQLFFAKSEDDGVVSASSI